MILAGERDRSGWWGAGRMASWGDAVAAAQSVAAACGVHLDVTADEHAPWHPGRCAALWVDDTLVGHAGELHPKVVASFALPERTAAMELDLDLLAPDVEGRTIAPQFSTQPVAKEDLALVVDADVRVRRRGDGAQSRWRPAGRVGAALRRLQRRTGRRREALTGLRPPAPGTGPHVDSRGGGGRPR